MVIGTWLQGWMGARMDGVDEWTYGVAVWVNGLDVQS